MQIPKVSFRLHPDDLEQLRKIAEARGVKVSDVIRQAILEFLRKQ